jgi:hypothetical protein
MQTVAITANAIALPEWLFSSLRPPPVAAATGPTNPN